MEYAKVKFYAPVRKKLDDIDIENDRLHGDVRKDGQLLASEEATLSADLRDKLSSQNVRSIWVKEPQYEWRQLKDDTVLRGEIIEKQNVAPVKHQLLRTLPAVESPQALKRLLNEYERADVSDMVYSKLVTARQLLRALLNEEEELTQKLVDVDEEFGALIDELNSRNPVLNPDKYQNKKLVRKLLDFVNNMRRLRGKIAEIILEADKQATPDSELIKKQHKNVYQALSKNKDGLVQSTQLAYELLQNRQKIKNWSAPNTFLENIHTFLSSLTIDGDVKNEALNRIIKILSDHKLPCSYWLMPTDTAKLYNIFEDAAGRLALYHYLFPESFRENPTTLTLALLGCDLGMLNVPEANWLHEEELRPRQKNAVEEHVEKSINLFEQADLLTSDIKTLIKAHHAPKSVDDPRAKKIALCDQYVSLTASRGWRDAYKPAQALSTLNNGLDATVLMNKVTPCPPATLCARDDTVFLVRSINDGVRWHGNVLKKEDGDFDLIGQKTMQELPGSEMGHRVVPWHFRRQILEP